jgi:hypothetical protein
MASCEGLDQRERAVPYRSRFDRPLAVATQDRLSRLRLSTSLGRWSPKACERNRPGRGAVAVLKKVGSRGAKSDGDKLQEQARIDTIQILERLARLGDNPESRRTEALAILKRLRSVDGVPSEQQILIASIEHQLNNPMDYRSKCNGS